MTELLEDISCLEGLLAESRDIGPIAEPDPMMTPYRHLAYAVISGALTDVADSARQADLGYAIHAAKRLRDSQVFQFWCQDVLELDAGTLVDSTMKHMLAGERVRFTAGYETYGATDGDDAEDE